MRSNRPYIFATISPKGERFLAGGHPWVYDAEIEGYSLPDGTALSDEALSASNGTLVDVRTRKGSYIGTGMLSLSSKIRVRLITRNANDRFDAVFWERKIRWAWEYRKAVMGADASACRVVFGEADGFPGLVVDRFEDVLVAQVLTFGIEQLKDTLFPLFIKVFAEDGITLRGIYERNDVRTRELEGLAQAKGWWGGADELAKGGNGGIPPCRLTSTIITENGVRYHVDFENGQKTGFFLDQKYNRRAVAQLAAGRRVLDCFTHTGSFALNAAMGGAAHVNAVDVSQLAIDQARANAQLNALDDRMEFTCANVFDLLPALEQARQRAYDFIVLDPPAFTKSRKTVGSAARGYKEINYRAMKLLPRGGFLATASCSHFMDTDRFRAMLSEAAHDAGVQLRQIEERQQAPDHPILWGVPETDYLKFFIFQVI